MRYWTQVGNEVIAYQDGKTARLMTECFESIMTAGVFTDRAIAESGLSKILLDQMGLSVEIAVVDSSAVNACVAVPDIDRNNPLINDWERKWFRNGDLAAIQKFVNGKFNGLVDRENARVGGDFSKLTVPMYITRGLLASPEYTPGEKAAVIGHECGHIFTYFERMVDTLTSNYAALSSVERILNTARPEDRIEILREYDSALGVSIPDKENTVRLEKGEAIYVHVVAETIKQRRNEEGDLVYSYRGFEQSSDQFTTRHGFGRDLVTALDKIHRSSFYNSSYVSWPTHIAVQVIKVTGYLLVLDLQLRALFIQKLLGAAFNLFALILPLLADRPMNKSYDEPFARAERIRREMIGQLKDKNLLPAKRRQIVEDIEIITETMKGVEDKRPVMEAVWAYIVPAGRDSRAKMEYQQMIERLANNDLFTKSAKLKDVGES